MYEEIMIEVHRQWLSEFDVEAARRRQLPRKPRGAESRARPGLMRRRRTEAAALQPCEA